MPICACRSPHGERGLKFKGMELVDGEFSRSPHGERGLKYREHPILGALASRSPHGERGLKSEDALLTAFDGEVALLMESVD